MLCSTDRVETYPKGRDPGLLQRGGPAGDQLQDLQVLGVGVLGPARSGRQRQRSRDTAHQAGK